ncbi:MAG: nuclear transport factor 2 family protein [Stellaceae bacterium]
MRMTRRDLAIAGVLAIGAANLLRGSAALAQASDEGAVKDDVDALRKALLSQDKAELDKLTADQLSYGHSDGRVQNKAEFIDGVMKRKAVIKSLTFPDLKISLAGDAAIVRHLYVSESEADGKITNTKIGVLCVWQKQDGNWKLLARQAYKLAQT